eukprot:1869477-Amphidinium_carterae.1
MIPLNDAYMLSLETRLDYETIREIFEHGFSRVPVYGRDKHDYRGLLYTKDLMLADPEDCEPPNSPSSPQNPKDDYRPNKNDYIT